MRGKVANKASMIIRNDFDKYGTNPAEMLMEVYSKAMQAFDSGRGYGEKSDAGAAYLSTALGAATTLAKHYYPTMSAVKIEDVTDKKTVGDKPIDAQVAINIVQSDPFLKSIANKAKATDSLFQILPTGNKDE